jgi:hypothetical protein
MYHELARKAGEMIQEEEGKDLFFKDLDTAPGIVV